MLGNGVNIALNLLLVYGVGSVDGLGIAGSAIGTVVAQVLSALALLWVVVRGARPSGASLVPDLPGIRAAGPGRRRAGGAHGHAAGRAARHDVRRDRGRRRTARVSLAAHQVAITLWTFLAFVLDAIAIAAQAITGRYLGAGDVAGTRAVTRRMVQWGVVAGVVSGPLLAGVAPWLGPLFSDDPSVHALLVPVLLLAAVGQPVAGVVFVLDGVLIGAGDGRYLAWAGLAVLVVYAPVVLRRGVPDRGPGRGLGDVRRAVHGRPARRCSCTAPGVTRWMVTGVS